MVMPNVLTPERIEARILAAFSVPYRAVVEVRDYRTKVGFEIKSVRNGACLYRHPEFLVRLCRSDSDLCDIITNAKEAVAKVRFRSERPRAWHSTLSHVCCKDAAW
jgi:hypothetical protein